MDVLKQSARTNVMCKRLLRYLVDQCARYESRAEVLKRHDIPGALYRKIVNESLMAQAPQVYRAPAEWIVDITNESKNYSAMEGLAALTGGVYLNPEQVEAIISVDPDKLTNILNGLVSIVKEARNE